MRWGPWGGEALVRLYSSLTHPFSMCLRAHLRCFHRFVSAASSRLPCPRQAVAGGKTDKDLQTALSLTDAVDYHYLDQSGVTEVEGINDEKDYNMVRDGGGTGCAAAAAAAPHKGFGGGCSQLRN